MSNAVMIPSKYQVNVWDFVKCGRGHAVIDAVAGSGKTTTILKCLEMIPRYSKVIFLAFNKAIVEELSKRVPEHVKVKTLHGLGFGAIRNHWPDKIFKDEAIVENLIASQIKGWGVDEENEYNYGRRVGKLVNLIRVNLVRTPEALTVIADKHEVEITNGECERAFEILRLKLKTPWIIDFTDMLFIPASNYGDSMSFEKFDYVFVDECQDLNVAQQRLVEKILAPGGRRIAVGDPRQAIYGFAGADSESFETLANKPNTTRLPLSVNYRCGRAIIEFVKKRFPEIPIEAHDGAPEGKVDLAASVENIKDADYVLCRNTAPLVQLCLEFIGQQRKAYVKGGDLGKNIVSLIKKSKIENVNDLLDYMHMQLTEIGEKLAKARPNASEEEIWQMPTYKLFAEKITVIATISKTCKIKISTEIVKKIEEIFSDKKVGICLSTVHRSKGLEADHVHIIERDLMPSKFASQPWQKEQEYNLEYVAYTRAKESLNFITDWAYEKN